MVNTIYTAGPVDLAQDMPNWRQQLHDILNVAGYKVTIFDPSTAFKITDRSKITDEASNYIEKLNNGAILHSDIVVCVLPHNILSVGTVAELDFCAHNLHNVILITDIPRGKSVYLNNRVPPANWIYIKSFTDPIELEAGLNAAVELMTTDKDKHKTMPCVCKIGHCSCANECTYPKVN
jgi:nucleoside 2-deoxyribosyltransferase